MEVGYRHHVGLEEGSLEEDVVVVEGLVGGGKDRFGHLLGAVQVVVAIRKHLGFNDRHQTVGLTDLKPKIAKIYFKK